MADKNSPDPMEDKAIPVLEGLVLRDIPFVGTYSSRVFNEKHQSTVPSDLRTIFMMRQGVKKTGDIALFCEIDEGSVYLFDCPGEGSFPDVRLVRIDRQGRIVLPHKIFSMSYAIYVGKGDYIEVTPSEQPLQS